MSKHTPGEWKVTKLSHADDQLWLQITGPDGRGPIVRVNSPGEPMPDGVIAESKLLITPEENQWANARLIAKAPTMAALLQHIVNAYYESTPESTDFNWTDFIDRCEALDFSLETVETYRCEGCSQQVPELYLPKSLEGGEDHPLCPDCLCKEQDLLIEEIEKLKTAIRKARGE